MDEFLVTTNVDLLIDFREADLHLRHAITLEAITCQKGRRWARAGAGWRQLLRRRNWE